jgi:multidrug efflux pump subunit AcrA (membrane-fusion protein)
MKNEPKGFPETRQPSLVWLSLIFLALAALAGCRTSAPAAKAATAPPALPVKLSVLETSAIPRVTEYVARLESRESVVVRSRTEGYVTRILVRPGDVVGAGAVLVEVDARRQAAQLETARAAVETARADLSQSQAALSRIRIRPLPDAPQGRRHQPSGTRPATGRAGCRPGKP